jgi:endonuclease YncB( thermonuclease family)
MFRFVRLSAVIGLLFFAFVCFWPAVNKDHAGTTKVIDANTLEVKGERHQLYGVIDAGQACRKWNLTPQDCSDAIIAALTDFLHGRPAYCEVRHKTGRDDEKRFVSVCYVGRDDIGAWMVDNGWAIADRSADRLRSTIGNEDRARFLRKGFWKETQPQDRRRR